MTSSLPRKCSTTELQQHYCVKSRAKVQLFFVSANFFRNKLTFSGHIGIYFAKKEVIKPIIYGNFEVRCAPYRTPILQYRMGVRLPLLHPCSRAIYLANGDGGGIVSDSRVTFASASNPR